jgi:hypothetical protein
MNSYQVIRSTIPKYLYVVTKIKNYKGIPKCEYPREVHRYRRSPCKTFVDFEHRLLREIHYPPELWGTFADQYDYLEDELINIKNTVYDWEKIKVILVK